MAILSNNFTTQVPITSGRTGTQAIKWINAPRVFVKASDTTPTPVTVKANGATPSGGWVDLGIVDGDLGIAYTKELKEIRTGIDNFLRLTYASQRNGSFTANLSQFDDKVIEEVSGITPSVITSGSIIQFAVGQEDVVKKAVLLVCENKLDGKEFQFYHPNADISFNITNSGEFTVVELTANLTGFTYNSKDTLFIMSEFA